jgi:hypothetical protein
LVYLAAASGLILAQDRMPVVTNRSGLDRSFFGMKGKVCWRIIAK